MPNSNEGGQYRILPEAQYVPELRLVLLDQIDGESLEPERSFVESVRAMGVIQPIVLVVAENGTYKLVAGRRRLTAMKEITDDSHWTVTTIPALVFPYGTPASVAAAMALTENVQRRPNPLTDLESIEAMVAEGAQIEDIARQLHMPVGTVRARMRLAQLIPDLRQGLRDGLMAPSTAERACRLDGYRQIALADTLTANGRLTSADVTNVLRARAAEQVDALPDSMFHNADWAAGNGTVNIGLAPGGTISDAQETGRMVRMEELSGEAGAPEIDASWPNVLRSLERAEESLPMVNDQEGERIVEWLTDLVVLVRGRANAA